MADKKSASGKKPQMYYKSNDSWEKLQKSDPESVWSADPMQTDSYGPNTGLEPNKNEPVSVTTKLRKKGVPAKKG